MRIGIDARLIDETGVGRYIKNLLMELSAIDKKNEYVIFLRKPEYQCFLPPNTRWSKRLADVPWHSVAEQIVMPWVFGRAHLDILHVPYFNAPILYPRKYILTIHDLTILHFDTGKASTLPYWLYKIRRIGYRIVLSVGIKRAAQIICVSHTVKKDIMARFHKPSEEISVTYEGVDPAFLKRKEHVASPIHGNYFLYVGNVYPHKNIDTLLAAYFRYAETSVHPHALVFVGPDDYFYRKLKASVPPPSKGRIIFLHAVSNAVMRILYEGATALLFPSLTEGFGLPAVEALALGCPVVCSDIPVFHEVLGNHATYIDPTSSQDFSQAMLRFAGKPLTRVNAASYLSRFSWNTMAKQTLALYESV